MKKVQSKYGTCIYENGKPLTCTVQATFVSRFENDGRWFARVKPLRPEVLHHVYTMCHIPNTPEMIVKLPYRYKRFSCPVWHLGAPSSVYALSPGDEGDFSITMTESNEHVNWKCNSINIHTQSKV